VTFPQPIFGVSGRPVSVTSVGGLDRSFPPFCFPGARACSPPHKTVASSKILRQMEPPITGESMALVGYGVMGGVAPLTSPLPYQLSLF